MEFQIEFYKKFGHLPVINQVHHFADETLNIIPENLYDGFKQPPEKILAWLKERGKNLKLTDAWDEMDSAAHNKAFTVSKVMSADLLQTIYNHVEKAKQDGLTLKQFQDSLLPELEKSGWKGATPSRLKVIYDTNMRMAQAQGKFKQQKLLSKIYPFLEYFQIERSTKRDIHIKWHKKKFRVDDPIWNIIYAPSAFGCGCTVVSTKDGTGVEDGNQYLEELQNSNDYKISPLKAWEPDTTKYVDGIKSQLEKFVGKPKQSTQVDTRKTLSDNNINLEVNLKENDSINEPLFDNIVKKLLANKDIAEISNLIIDYNSEYDTGFETYTTNMAIGYKLITDATELGKYRKLMSKKANPKVAELSDDDFIDYTLKHELSHIRYNRLGTELKELKYELDFELNKIYADYTKDYDPYEFDPENPGHIYSKYSTINKDEMLAEAFALRKKGLDTNNIFIDKIFSVFEKYEKGLKNAK